MVTAKIGNTPNTRLKRSSAAWLTITGRIYTAGIGVQLSEILIAEGVTIAAIKKQNGARQRHEC